MIIKSAATRLAVANHELLFLMRDIRDLEALLSRKKKERARYKAIANRAKRTIEKTK